MYYMQPHCPFCLSNQLLKSEILAETPAAFLIEALNSKGNYLIISKTHAESLLDLPDDWWHSMKELLPQVPNLGEHYNLSLNIGKHAGQTVRHLHFWIVPRAANMPSTGNGLATLIEKADKV